MTELQQPTFDGPTLDAIERRILEATIELAAAGGYEAVKQRDVAMRAKVALATVYTRFASKDILLAAALEFDNRRWMPELCKVQLRGRTPLARVTKLFEHMTALWVRRPELARASLRAATCGDQRPCSARCSRNTASTSWSSKPYAARRTRGRSATSPRCASRRCCSWSGSRTSRPGPPASSTKRSWSTSCARPQTCCCTA